MVRCISSGSRQLLVKPASDFCSEQMKVFSSTRATEKEEQMINDGQRKYEVSTGRTYE